jgi:hypothetical protein
MNGVAVYRFTERLPSLPADWAQPIARHISYRWSIAGVHFGLIATFDMRPDAPVTAADLDRLVAAIIASR